MVAEYVEEVYESDIESVPDPVVVAEAITQAEETAAALLAATG